MAKYGENIDHINAPLISSMAFVAYQCSFAIITPALISGAVVGRMKLIPYMIFIFLVSSGISGLVAAIILGSLAHFDPDVINTGQTNLPFTVLGTGLLWVGWMGFNGGSALSADGT